jgi:hypothetical protein
MQISGGVQLSGGINLAPGGSSPTPVSEKIIAGAFFANSQQGKAYVYNTDGSSQVSISASDGNSDDKFGFSVAVSGSKVAIGAYGSPNNTAVGAVYVFDADGSNQVKIVPTNGDANDEFGYSVAINGTKVIVGSPGDDDNGGNSGCVYTYNLDGTGETKIKPSDGSSSQAFGKTVKATDSKIAVAAPGTGIGSVYTFDLDGSNQAKMTPSDGSSGWEFGNGSLAINGTKVVAGARRRSSFTGGVYTFDHDGSNQNIITASDGATSDTFGTRVDATDSKIAVTGGGTIYTYNIDGTGEVIFTPSPALSMTQDFSIAIGSSKIVYGQTYDGSSFAGKVITFDLDGTNRNDITATGGGSGDRLGVWVAIG